MSTPTIPVWTPRTQRRNRLALAGFGVSMLPLASVAMWLSSSVSTPGPLLVAMDELAVVPRIAVIVELPHAIQTEDPDAGFHIAAWIAPLICDVFIPAEPVGAPQEDASVRWFNGRPVRPVRTMFMLTTGYSPDERSCGESADGVTASGYSVWTNGMKLAAADTSILPFGSMISVPGYNEGEVIPVLDRGGAIKGHRLDLLHPTHEQAMQWGVQRLEVLVWEYADGLPNDFVARFNRPSSVNP